MWLDLAAGPVSYGPKTSGSGGVRESTYPRVHQHIHGEEANVGEDEVGSFAMICLAVLLCGACVCECVRQ
jgi:hypothetical protein